MTLKKVEQPQPRARFDPTRLRTAVEMHYAEPGRAWGEIAAEMGIDPATLWRWRQSEEWEAIVRQVGAEHMQALIPDAIGALRKAFRKGMATAQAIDILRSSGLVRREEIDVNQQLVTFTLDIPTPAVGIDSEPEATA